MLRVDAARPFGPAHRQVVYAGRDVFHTAALYKKVRESWGGLPTHPVPSGLPDLRWDQPEPFVYAVERALVPAATAMSLRGFCRDEEKVQALLTAAEPELAALKAEAVALVTKNLGGWDNFNLASGEQLAQALYGRPDEPPCVVCQWTGVEVTRPASVVELRMCSVCSAPADEFVTTRCHDCGGAVVPLVYKSGPRKGQHKTKEYKERTRRCPEKHTYPGFGCKPYKDRETGNWVTDRESLGKLVVRERGKGGNVLAAELATLALTYSERAKVPQELRTPLGPNGRLRGELFLGGTDTFRWSSSRTYRGDGRNVQNLDHRTRAGGVYVAPSGRTFVQPDQSKAESHWLAAWARDERYLAAHEGDTDTHALVGHWIWPEVDWPEDRTQWAAFAKKLSFTKLLGLPYSIPDDNIRQVSKKVQHGIGRMQSAAGVATTLQCSRPVAERVLQRFHDELPTTMHFLGVVAKQVAAGDVIHFGRHAPQGEDYPHRLAGPMAVLWPWGADGPPIWRAFLTDPKDSATARDFISFALQAPVALTTNLAILRTWQLYDTKSSDADAGVVLLAHQHDGMDCEVPEELVGELTPKLINAMEVRYSPWGRALVVPVEATVGRVLK